MKMNCGTLLGKSSNILDPPTLIRLTGRVSIARIVFDINFRDKNTVRDVLKGGRNVEPLRNKIIFGGAENKDMDASHGNKLE